MVRIYGIKSCDTCRTARRWLEQHQINHEYLDIREDGLDADLLHRWETATGWESLVNKRSITWRKIPELDREDLDGDRAVQLILAYPTVLKRPVLDLGDRVILGFDEDSYRDSLT